MTQEVKLRLIGLAAILVAAAIIFPLFFDGAGYKERHLTKSIPEQPVQPVVIDVEPMNAPLEDTSELAELAKIEIPALETTLGSMSKDTSNEKVTSQKEVKEVKVPVVKVVEKAKQEVKPEIQVEVEKPTLDQQGVPVAWTLQLASFKDETNARSLRKQLVNKGHKVYTRKQRGLVKVYVGPDLQRTKLEQLKSQLKKNMGLDGIIVRFTTQ